MADSGRKNIKGFLQLGGGAGLRNNAGVIEPRNAANSAGAALNASDLQIGGTSIRQVAGQILGVDYYSTHKSLFPGLGFAPLPITGCRVSKASSTEINFASGYLSCPDSTSYHTQHLWAAASNQALNTIKLSGTVGANQTWYLYAYMASDTARVLTPAASLSAPASVPNGRLLGWLTTDGSGNIDKVWQWNQPDTCRLTNSATISIANNSTTTVDWDTERHDTNSMHSTSTNPSRITIQKGGQYFIELSILFAAESAPNSIKLARIVLNGSNILATQVSRSVGGGAVTHGISCCAMPYLQAGDYIEASVFQNTGASLNLLTTADVSNFGATLMEFH